MNIFTDEYTQAEIADGGLGMKTLTIIGRRWFQKTYGNTYNSVRILVDGAEVAYLERSYGYGDYYVQRAFEWLETNGHVQLEHYPNGGTEGWRQWAERNGVALHYEAIDVGRERDL